jgi:hypothetical protein
MAHVVAGLDRRLVFERPRHTPGAFVFRERAYAPRLRGRPTKGAAMADETVDETSDHGGGFQKLLLLILLAALGSFMLKRKREQELDEALWEEPRAL